MEAKPSGIHPSPSLYPIHPVVRTIERPFAFLDESAFDISLETGHIPPPEP